MEILGERVRLRPLAMSDLDKCLKWASDLEVMKHVTMRTVTDREEERAWVEEMLSSTSERVFAIEIRKTGEHIGNCSIHVKPNHPLVASERGKSIGLLIGEKSQWGKGYGAEVMTILSQFAIDEYGVDRVFLRVDTKNERAIRTYEKAGFSIVHTLDNPERINSGGKEFLMEKLF